MSNTVVDQIKVILQSFVGDPPDNDFQAGYLSAVLVIANEVAGIPRTDPLWRQADDLLSNNRRVSLKLVPSRPMPSPNRVK